MKLLFSLRFSFSYQSVLEKKTAETAEVKQERRKGKGKEERERERRKGKRGKKR